MHPRSLLLPFVLPVAAAAPAQDMFAVAWSGAVYALDSFAGIATPVGTGLPGQNACALDGADHWSTARTGPSTAYIHHLSVVDPFTGAGTIVWSGVPDTRGLAAAGGGVLLAITDGPADQLQVVDTTTGVYQPIGSTGRSSLQAAALRGSTLYAWDLGAGLMTVNLGSGLATDVNTGQGTGGADIQFLAVRSDGTLIGGRDSLYTIDTLSGVATWYATLGTLDLRGADGRNLWTRTFGQGCAGASGAVALGITGTPLPGNVVTTTSDHHAAAALAVLIVGFSTSYHIGYPLPLLLDPLIGTQGCNLWVSIDGTAIGFADAQGVFAFPLNVVPGLGGLLLHVQHAAFDPVQGGTSWSNGGSIRVGY